MNKMSGERKKNVTLHLPVSLMRKVRKMAKSNNRPISWEVTDMLERDIKRVEFERNMDNS